jgi:hypothetical protein
MPTSVPKRTNNAQVRKSEATQPNPSSIAQNVDLVAHEPPLPISPHPMHEKTKNARSVRGMMPFDTRKWHAVRAGSGEDLFTLFVVSWLLLKLVLWRGEAAFSTFFRVLLLK